jgi:hypothetical protein
MQLDENAKRAVRELGDAINSAVEKSARVAEAIENLREIGYEPHLSLKLEIGLQEIDRTDRTEDFAENDFAENLELELTDEDLRTLRRMKIKF